MGDSPLGKKRCGKTSKIAQYIINKRRKQQEDEEAKRNHSSDDSKKSNKNCIKDCKKEDDRKQQIESANLQKRTTDVNEQRGNNLALAQKEDYQKKIESTKPPLCATDVAQRKGKSLTSDQILYYKKRSELAKLHFLRSPWVDHRRGKDFPGDKSMTFRDWIKATQRPPSVNQGVMFHRDHALGMRNRSSSSMAPYFLNFSDFAQSRILAQRRRNNEREIPITGRRTIVHEDDFLISLRVSHFKARDLTVTVIGHAIVIECKHDWRQDRDGLIKRHIERRFELPRDVNPQTIKVKYSSLGILTLTAPRPPPSSTIAIPNERIIHERISQQADSTRKDDRDATKDDKDASDAK